MIKISERRFIIESLDELPPVVACKELFEDVETTSFDEDVKAFEPYNGHRICGYAFTWDNNKESYYIPVRHNSPGAKNLNPDAIARYMTEWETKAEAVVNHNLKYDFHFRAQEESWVIPRRMVDTLTQATMIETERMNHKLKDLCRDWCGLPMGEEKEIEDYLNSIRKGRKKCEDYGRLPVYLCGKYACMDVLGNRILWREIQARMPEELEPIAEREILLTPVLWDMEHRGLRIDRQQTLLDSRTCLRRMIQLQDRVDDLTGIELSTGGKSCEELLLGYLGLPPLAWGKRRKDGKRGLSFDKEAMMLYEGHEEVVTSKEASEIVATIREFRTLAQLKSLYYDPFLEKVDANGFLHSSYRQLVRTGRMACYNPNAQQFNQAAAKLILPRDGYTLCCWDGDQMEFRIIAHYIQNPMVTAAYQADPNVCFHNWVQDMCSRYVELSRGASKTVNFMTAFGAGKNKITHTLMKNKDVMSAVYTEGMTAEAYLAGCEARANAIYDAYHGTLPEIKQTAELARSVAAKRGYIRTASGRRRHVTGRWAYKAFNAMVQGTAADIIKRRMLEFPNWELAASLGVFMDANKHDELLFEVPTPHVDEFQIGAKQFLETTDVPLDVPITWSGHSGKNWAEAKG